MLVSSSSSCLLWKLIHGTCARLGFRVRVPIHRETKQKPWNLWKVHVIDVGAQIIFYTHTHINIWAIIMSCPGHTRLIGRIRKHAQLCLYVPKIFIWVHDLISTDRVRYTQIEMKRKKYIYFSGYKNFRSSWASHTQIHDTDKVFEIIYVHIYVLH